MPWKLYRFKYEDYPEYSARITGHYGGDLLVIEEEGEISEEAVRIIKEALGLNEDVRAFDISVGDVLNLPMKRLPKEDRAILLRAAEKLDSDSRLHVEYRYRPDFN